MAIGGLRNTTRGTLAFLIPDTASVMEVLGMLFHISLRTNNESDPSYLKYDI